MSATETRTVRAEKAKPEKTRPEKTQTIEKKRHPKLLDQDMRPILFEMFEMSGERMRIMEEFVICRKCRADAVMFAPERGIIGFEIKSDRDSLERLEHQIRDYSRFCDYNYLVTGAKYIDKAAEILPEFWGIYCITENSGELTISLRREAELSPKVRLQNQLKFLWRAELIDIMKRHKIRGYSSRNKSKIRRLLLDSMDKQELKQELYEMMMERDYSLYEEAQDEDD